MHVGGILTGGIVAPTLVLCLSYLFLGFAFVAVRLRTGLLWPIVASYALLLASAVAVQNTEASNLVASVADVMPAVTISLLLGAGRAPGQGTCLTGGTGRESLGPPRDSARD